MLDEQLVLDVNTLWEPVYPFLADHVLAASGFHAGRLLDVGPFAGGLALNVLWKNEAFQATVCDESAGVLRWVEERAAAGGFVSRLTTVQNAFSPLPFPSEGFEVIVVRGAFFFWTPLLLREVRRVLRPGGFGWVGGGYGPGTPEGVIAPLADRSRALNASLGKQWLSAEDARSLCSVAGVDDCARLSSDGGLWVELRP